jgi:1-acyl-sn-glycerol-3-phosphate acyltransferase
MASLSLSSLDSLRKLGASFLKPTNPDSVDQIDPEVIRLLTPIVDGIARAYLRLDIEGMDRVPRGKALVVGNHNAGITFLEPFGIVARWYLERGAEDPLHFLVHDAMVAIPLLRTLLVRGGCVRASHENGDQLLQHGHKVVVFPGGNLEAFRPYKDRFKIVFGGKKGFIRLALRHQVPMVPMVIVGGHESFMVLHDGQRLARLLHLKQLLRSETCPLFLGLPWGVGLGPIFHLHLPTKSTVRFLDPIPLDGYRPEDVDSPRHMEEIYQLVTGRMQQAMTEMASRRRWPVLG